MFFMLLLLLAAPIAGAASDPLDYLVSTGVGCRHRMAFYGMLPSGVKDQFHPRDTLSTSILINLRHWSRLTQASETTKHLLQHAGHAHSALVTLSARHFLESVWREDAKIAGRDFVRWVYGNPVSQLFSQEKKNEAWRTLAVLSTYVPLVENLAHLLHYLYEWRQWWEEEGADPNLPFYGPVSIPAEIRSQTVQARLIPSNEVFINPHPGPGSYREEVLLASPHLPPLVKYTLRYIRQCLTVLPVEEEPLFRALQNRFQDAFVGYRTHLIFHLERSTHLM